jgi:hypothetical protein
MDRHVIATCGTCQFDGGATGYDAIGERVAVDGTTCSGYFLFFWRHQCNNYNNNNDFAESSFILKFCFAE